MDWWTKYSQTRDVAKSLKSSNCSGHFQIEESVTVLSLLQRLSRGNQQHLMHEI